MTGSDQAREARELARELMASAAAAGADLDRHFANVEAALPALARHLDADTFATVVADGLARPLVDSGDLAVLRRQYGLLRDTLLGRGTRTDVQLIGLLENGIGSALLAGGQYDDAIAHFEESFACDERAGDALGRLDSIWNIVLAHAEAGRADSALQWIGRALDDFPGDGDRRLWAAFQLRRGQALLELERFAQAREPLEAALHAYHSMRDKGGVAGASETLVEVCGRLGDEAASTAFAEIALSIPLGMPYELPPRSSRAAPATAPTAKPRVFLSYRHEATTRHPDGARINAAHRQWVRQFAQDLEAHGLEVLWDGKMRAELQRRTTLKPDILPFAAELSRICPAICHGFLPVLTPSYLERAMLDEAGDPTLARGGGVYEEWMGAMPLVNGGHMTGVAIVSCDEAARYAERKFRPSVDFRSGDPAAYRGGLETVVGLMWKHQQSGRPPVDLDLAPWIDLYIHWCRRSYTVLAHAPIEAWTWRSNRPQDFLDAVHDAKRTIARNGQETTLEALQAALDAAAGAPEETGWSELLADAIHEAHDGQGEERLKFVAEAYRAARAAGERGASPTEDYRAQHNLGVAFAKIGSLAGSVADLELAVAAYRGAIDSLKPGDAANMRFTQLALADALWALGRLKRDTAALGEARRAFEAALATHGTEDDETGLRIASALSEIDAAIRAA